MSTLHREVVASTADSIAAKANGIWYTYAIQNGMGRVDLYICRSNKAENKAIFDELARHKRTIESAFGHQLDWQRRDDNPNSRIASFVEGSALNEDGWDDLHRKMVARMVYLERVFSPYIDRYRRGESPLSAP